MSPQQSAAVDDDSASLCYPVGAVAARLDLPIATLRSWARRYRIGPADHRAGQRRLYSESDIRRFQRMAELVRQGVSPSSAARSVFDAERFATTDVSALLAAAWALDAYACDRHLDHRLRRDGVIDTWDGLIRPAFDALAARQREGAGCLDVEHVLSWSVSRALQRLPLPVAVDNPVIVLSCMPGEVHTLALEALRAALAERGRATVMLGADTPVSAVFDALSHLSRTAEVVLWAHTHATADPRAAADVVERTGSVMVAGPGWATTVRPEGATYLEGLGDAVRRLLGAA